MTTITHDDTVDEDAFYVLRGAAPSEEPDTDAADADIDEGGEPDTDGDDDTDADPGEDDDDEEDEDDETDEVKSLRADLDAEKQKVKRLRGQVRESDRRANAAETELRSLRKSDTSKKGAASDAAPESDASAARIAELQAQLADQQVRNAFTSLTKYQWHNPAAAFKLLNLDDVHTGDKIDDDALADAVDALATDHPYLVKAAEAPKRAKPARPTGSQQGAQKRDRTQKTDYSSQYAAFRGLVK